jgi:hypothetical protein
VFFANYLACIAVATIWLLISASRGLPVSDEFLGIKGGTRGPAWGVLGLEPFFLAGYFTPRLLAGRWARLSMLLVGIFGITSILLRGWLVEHPFPSLLGLYIWLSHVSLAAVWRSTDQSCTSTQLPPPPHANV